MKITIDLPPETVEALDLLRRWTGARSRSIVVKWLIEEGGRKWAGRPAGWVDNRWEPVTERGGKDGYL